MAATPRTGYVLLLLSVLCNGATYHLSHWALKDFSPAMVNLTGNFASVGFLLLGGVLWRATGWRVGEVHVVTPRSIGQCFAGQWRLILLATALGSVGGWLNTGANQAYGAAMTAFLANLTLVFLVIFGVISGERLTALEVLTVGAILLGAFMFSWRDGALLWGVVGLMALSCLGTAGKQMVVKRATTLGNMPSMMAATLALMGSWTTLIGLGTGTLQVPAPKPLLITVLAGLVGSVLGMTFLYSGYHAVGVSRGAPVDAMRPMVVLLIGLLLGAALPGPVQLAGGALILGGSVALAMTVSRRAKGRE
jgi:drug/metabolite transporter (DMT)-like permease